MTLRYDLVLLDLDGTLIDSEPGVQAALRYALLEGFGIVPTPEQEAEFMGPPLDDVLPRVFGLTDPADVPRFFELWTSAYFHGTEFDFGVFPGMVDLVRELDEAGVRLVLATAKPTESAGRILDHAGLSGRFAFVAGSGSDGSRQDKIEVLEHAFAAMPGDAVAERVILVGDRAIDVRAARAHGIDSVIVDWGYSMAGEFDEYPPTHVVDTVAELRSLLLGD